MHAFMHSVSLVIYQGMESKEVCQTREKMHYFTYNDIQMLTVCFSICGMSLSVQY